MKKRGKEAGGSVRLFEYDGKPVRVTDHRGSAFAGVAEFNPPDFGLHECGREEESLQIGDVMIFESDIEKVEFLPSFEEAAATITVGRYRHFKGRDYEVLAVARHSETEEPMVVYRALYGEGGVWVRPASMWNETVERNGKTYRRLYPLERIKRVEKYERLFDEVGTGADPEKLSQLEEYYSSGQWLEDYEADERGELPPDMKRGVLSQDALYNLLEGAVSRKS